MESKHSATRRSLLTLVVGLAWLLVGSNPAGAKMPEFSVEVDSQGHQITITVRIDGIAGQDFNARSLKNLLALYPSSVVDERGRPISHREAIPIDLVRMNEGVYQGTVIATHDGRFLIVRFPGFGEVTSMDPPTSVTIETDRGLSWIWPTALAGLLTATFARRLGSSQIPRSRADRSRRWHERPIPK